MNEPGNACSHQKRNDLAGLSGGQRPGQPMPGVLSGVSVKQCEEKLVLQRPESMFEKIWTMPGLEAPCSIVEQAESKNPKQGECPMQNNPHTNSEVRHGP